MRPWYLREEDIRETHDDKKVWAKKYELFKSQNIRILEDGIKAELWRQGVGKEKLPFL